MRPVLVTGASGGLGRQVAAGLGALGWGLVLTDIAPFPDEVPAGSRFEAADLNDGPTILRLAEGCGTILHFGGISTEHAFETVLGPNLRGIFHVYEAARRERARVMFASSNHAIGYHPRANVLDHDCQFRPDTFYGLSKAYGELMGRMYWDKHGVENVNVRIGSSFPEPRDDRMLATWLSYPDLLRLMQRCVLADGVGHCVVWGASANSRMTWWRHDHRERLDWSPQDSADPFADRIGGVGRGDPFTDTLQGGGYTTFGTTRTAPAPADLFSPD